MSFANMTVRSKLTTSFAILAVMVVVVSLLAMRSLSQVHEDFQHYTDEVSVRLALANEVQAAADARAISARNLVLVTSPADRDAEKAAVTQAHGRVTTSMAKLKDMLARSGAVSENERG